MAIKTKLVYCPSVGGHYFEYLCHLHNGAVSDKHNRYVFAIPEKYREKGYVDDWKEPNISFDFISQSHIDKLWKHSFRLSKDIKFRCNKYNADEVILLTLMLGVPYLPFLLLGRKTIMSGIIYNIYLYNWSKLNFFNKLCNALIYCLLAKISSVGNVYLLNDAGATFYLNRLYSTEHFKFLPDPYNDREYEAKDIRDSLSIPSPNCIYLMFGALTERKGVLDVLDAISLLTPEEAKNKTFIFAGKISNAIQEQFYEKMKFAGELCQILVFDKFCTYEFLYDLCKTSNVLLIPYKNTSFSSGCIAYADNFKLPVIGPKGGLLGKLIKKYHLGITLETLSPDTIKTAIIGFENRGYCPGVYVKTHRKEDFFKSIIFE